MKEKVLQSILLMILFGVIVESAIAQECTPCDPLYGKYEDALLVGRVEKVRYATAEEIKGIWSLHVEKKGMRVINFFVEQAFEENVKSGKHFEILTEGIPASWFKVGVTYLVYTNRWGGKSSYPLGLDAERTKPLNQSIDALDYIKKCIAKKQSDENKDKEFDEGIYKSVIGGKALSLPKPVYPDEAKKEKISGNIPVQILIDENGQVIKARAVCGHPLLVKAAEEAAMKARYSPTTISGKPIKVIGVVNYNFMPE